MPPKERHRLDKNVSPNWRPPAINSNRKPGMLWSDRIWHWLISLGGLCLVVCGVAAIAYLRLVKWGGAMVGLGMVVFALGFPSQAQRNGYRE